MVEDLNLDMIFLISPQTETERIKLLDAESRGFLYVVSSSSITGQNADLQQAQKSYFDRINRMNLRNPTLIGFGISDRKSYEAACRNASGAIIGSAFIRALKKEGLLKQHIHDFVKSIRS